MPVVVQPARKALPALLLLLPALLQAAPLASPEQDAFRKGISPLLAGLLGEAPPVRDAVLPAVCVIVETSRPEEHALFAPALAAASPAIAAALLAACKPRRAAVLPPAPGATAPATREAARRGKRRSAPAAARAELSSTRDAGNPLEVAPKRAAAPAPAQVAAPPADVSMKPAAPPADVAMKPAASLPATAAQTAAPVVDSSPQRAKASSSVTPLASPGVAAGPRPLGVPDPASVPMPASAAASIGVASEGAQALPPSEPNSPSPEVHRPEREGYDDSSQSEDTQELIDNIVLEPSDQE